MPPLEAHLFVDYQNVHITAHEQFGTPGTPLYLSLIHPGRLANAIDAERAAHNRLGAITQVHVFRGLPSAGHEPDSYRRNLAQTAGWQKDRRVIVHSRSLRYPRDWPDTKAREKGVDVMLAATFIYEATIHAADVLILASRDTDLAPAVELAAQVPNAPMIEICNWDGAGQFRCSMTPQPWCTYLNQTDFLASRDPRQY